MAFESWPCFLYIEHTKRCKKNLRELELEGDSLSQVSPRFVVLHFLSIPTFYTQHACLYVACPPRLTLTFHHSPCPRKYTLETKPDMSGLKAVMRVSPALAKVLGDNQMPRTEAVKRM